MTLLETLTALSGNEKLFVTIKDSEGTELVTFNASGYPSIESDLEAKVVDSIEIISQQKVTVNLVAENVEPTNDDSNNATEPNNDTNNTEPTNTPTEPTTEPTEPSSEPTNP
jgi:hypothetical protein